MDDHAPDPAAEVEADYRALREDAAAVDLAGWTVLRLRGPDARTFLQGLASQDLSRLILGRAAMTLFLTDKGRPVTLAWVAITVDRTRPDSAVAAGAPAGGAPGELFHLVADEGARGVLLRHLERFRVMEDVELEGPAAMPRLLGIVGPARDRILVDAEGVIHGAVPVRGEPLSFLLLPPDLPAVSLPPIARPEAFEAWRLSVGIPRTGVDLDPERIATELSLAGAISQAKGCYVGQEVVARTSTRGHVRRHRVGFRFHWGGAPIPRAAEIHAGGAAVGYVTSTAPEPGTPDGLGMGYLALDAQASSPDLFVEAGSRSVPIRIGAWPL